MHWAGFNGTDAELRAWLAGLKAWSQKLAKRKKREDMAEEIEGKALEYLASKQQIGCGFDRELERLVSRECGLNDNFKLARDCDLTARLNEEKDHGFISSWFDTVASDPAPEETILSSLDGDPIEEGRDQIEIFEEIESKQHLLLQVEDQVLSLRHLYGYNQTEIASFLRCSQGKVSYVERRTKARLRAKAELETYNAKCLEDPSYSQMEVSWIKI